ncbi:MAG: hypothetical protein FD156_657 [Nitrospirae bacterium]|nr:MAG: hypothetical protein FD156_657 [Nitrospirota bacterium]
MVTINIKTNKLTILIIFILFCMTILPLRDAFGFILDPSKLPDEYSFTEIKGTVIDAETKKPIEGVVVVALWKINWLGRPGVYYEGGTAKVIHAEEAVTDKNGKYTIPAWGPIKRPKEWAFNGADPSIEFFKPGYSGERLSNYFWLSSWVSRGIKENYTYSKIRKSYWDGKVIDLEPFIIGKKIPIKDRYYTKERIKRYVIATQHMWESELDFIRGIFYQIEDADKKEINEIPIELAPYIETRKVKNLLKVFAEEREKTSKPLLYDIPQRFEDYLREIKNEK